MQFSWEMTKMTTFCEHLSQKYWPLLSTIEHYWPLLKTIQHTIDQYWPLFKTLLATLTTIQNTIELLTNIEHYWPLFKTLLTTIEHYWTLLNTIQNTIEHYWTLLTTIEHYSTLQKASMIESLRQCPFRSRLYQSTLSFVSLPVLRWCSGHK